MPTKKVNSTTTIAMTSPFQSTTDNNKTSNNNNGSFVLIVNISPNEFRLRQNEIIREFEKKLGILMLIKKDSTTANDMIYPFYSSKQHESLNQAWTKVYFIIIFACVYDEAFYKSVNNSICLQNSLNDKNDPSEIVSELKKAATNSLLPTYVSNITYEAYSSDTKKRKNEFNDNTSNKDHHSDTLSTTLVIILAIGLLIGISLALTVLIRQNAATKRMIIKAPIWYPPPIDGQQGGFKKCPKIGEYSSKDGNFI
jgi:hypothetical protein